MLELGGRVPLTSPAQEEVYHRKYGTPEQQSFEKFQIAEYERMPNKPKVVSGNYKYDKLRGNIGNLLHEPQTVDRLFDRLSSQRPFE
uniref:Uncharacterized protein n=1 Tax=Romanomermis culicivorax TaxID=13658 RepID=A0A915KD70_ROMCU